MSSIWIVRFLPHGGAINHDLTFRTEAAARVLFDTAAAHKEEDGRVVLQSDFGVKISINPALCDIVFTGTEISAAAHVALNEANHDAARTYGLPQGALSPGSTLQ